MLYFLNYKLLSLICLIVLETILGIDNLIFINIIANRLPEHQRRSLVVWGLSIACICRIVFLALISWIIQLNKPIFAMLGINFSWKMIILIMGGIFLIYKSVMELYYNAYPEKDTLDNQEEQTYKFNILLLQIILIDIIFSIESVIASIGTVTEKWMMYTAIIVSIMIMIASSDFISDFIDQNPSFRTLGLCFLLLIGSVLVVEGIGFTIQSGYVHGAMGFAFLVTVIQMTQIN